MAAVVIALLIPAALLIPIIAAGSEFAGKVEWLETAWVLSPLGAAFLCARASLRSQGPRRRAWLLFCLGSLGWSAGSAYWAIAGLSEASDPVPSAADIGYLLSALCYAGGIFAYSIPGRPSRMQSANIALCFACTAFAVFEVSGYEVASHETSLYSGLIIISYPVLWLATAVFAALAVLLYVPRAYRIPMALTGSGVATLAAASLLYALDVARETYQVGLYYDVFWVIGFGLIGCGAASDTILRPVRAETTGDARRQRLGESLVPAVAASIFLSAAVYHGVSHGGDLYFAAIPAALAITIMYGVRETALRQTIEEHEELSASILKASPDGIAVLDTLGRYGFVNRRGLDLIEVTSVDEIRGRTVLSAWPWSDRLLATFTTALSGGEAVQYVEAPTVRGHLRCWKFTMVPLRSKAGTVTSVLATWRDVTEAEHARAEITAAHARLSNVLESTTDSVIVLDRDFNITFINSKAEELVAKGRELTPGVNLWRAFPGERGSVFDRNYRQVMETRQPMSFEAFLKEGELWLEVHAYPTDDGLSIFFRDITERKLTEQHLSYIARHDQLTGAANRFCLEEVLDLELERASRERQLALLLIDFDDFKDVNDTLGHPAGDRILQEATHRIATHMPQGLVARLGGDEFAVALPGVGDLEALRRAAETLTEDLSRPFLLGDEPVQLSASIGIALAPADAADRTTLLQNADIGLYSAKGLGKRTFCFFERDMAEYLKTKQSLKADIFKALEREEFSLAFQPIVDLATQDVCSYEALLRWVHPTRGLVSPSLLVPLAEEAGLIGAIGEWVLRRACSEAARWPEDVRVSVNLSPAQFVSRSLPLRVAEALAQSGLQPSRLELEITESVLLNDSEANLAMLHQLKELGARIALDDFGTGYSSLSYLNRFPFDKIKIDRCFISTMPEKAEARAIVRSVAELGHSLGMRITAEGIETEAQLELLRRKGCDEGQGFLFSPPMPAEKVLEDITLRGIASTRRTGNATGGRLRGAKGQAFRFDELPAEIAIVDGLGTIVSTNRAWEETAAAGKLNGASAGWNYIEECEAAASRGCEEARDVALGLRSVLNGQASAYSRTYSCAFDRRCRWYRVTVVPHGEGALLMHFDVTALQTDPLTGLSNRIAFEGQLAYMLDCAAGKARQPASSSSTSTSPGALTIASDAWLAIECSGMSPTG